MIRYGFRALTNFAVENRIAGFGWSTIVQNKRDSSCLYMYVYRGPTIIMNIAQIAEASKRLEKQRRDDMI